MEIFLSTNKMFRRNGRQTIRFVRNLSDTDSINRGGSSIGSISSWYASGPEFDPYFRYIISWRLGHEKISTAILPLLLIQEEQLSVTGERMCTKNW